MVTQRHDAPIDQVERISSPSASSDLSPVSPRMRHASEYRTFPDIQNTERNLQQDQDRQHLAEPHLRLAIFHEMRVHDFKHEDVVGIPTNKQEIKQQVDSCLAIPVRPRGR